MITCPKCGRLTAEGVFCGRCGSELPSEPQLQTARRDGNCHAGGLDECGTASVLQGQQPFDSNPNLEFDRSCPLFENVNSILRFRFVPQGQGTLENVVITFTNCDSPKRPVHRIGRISQVYEFPVQFPPQCLGLQAWDVLVEYSSRSRRYKLTGCFQVIVKPVGSLKRGVEDFNIKIETNIGNVSQASDVTVNSNCAESLACLLASTDPFEEMNRVYSSKLRQWSSIPLLDDGRMVDLPPMPVNARAEHIELIIENRHFHFFAKRTIKFGRKKEVNDISLRPVPGAGEAASASYCRVSREQCFFEHSGSNVLLSDGSRNSMGILQQSSGGTFLNGERLIISKELPAGTVGVVSFGGDHHGGGLSLDIRVCEPSKACTTCPYVDTHWCANGTRPTLVLSRRDAIQEKFIGLWSCFSLGEADPSFAGVTILRKNGAFAYRFEDGRSGWLVPGSSVQMDIGFVTVA